MNMITTYIAFGSNLGDREENVAQAVKMVRSLEGVTVTDVSALYETDPVSDIPQRKYLNGVMAIETMLSARKLLSCLEDIELSLGRKKHDDPRWAPRCIDLDILLYGQEMIREEGLSIPHPLMHEREFVLKPLCSIAPDVLHPGLGMTASELAVQQGIGV